MYTATRNLYTDGSRTRLVEENDPAARFLLVAKGCRIDDQLARRFGLLPGESKAEAKAITPDSDSSIQNKRVTPKAAGARNKGKASK